MLLAMLLAGANVQSAYKQQSAGEWLISPNERGCMADKVFVGNASVNLWYFSKENKVMFGFSDPKLTFVREGSMYGLSVVFRRPTGSPNLTPNPWENHVFMGADLSGTNAMVGAFKSPILDDFASSSSVALYMNGKFVSGFQIPGGSAMVAALRECARIREKETSTTGG